MGNISNNREKCPSCGKYPSRPLSIDALIIRNGKILLIKRGIEPYKDFWALPGGHVDFNETVEEAVKRETEEETNLKVVSLKLLGVYSNPKRHPNQSVAVSYIAETTGEPRASDDAKECRFFPLDELPKDLAFDHKKIIEDYKEATRVK